MNRCLTIDQNYLYIPIKPGKDEIYIKIFIADERETKLFTEVKIPYCYTDKSNYDFDFYAEISFKDFYGKDVLIDGDADERFFNEIVLGSKKASVSVKKPVIHFAENSGWINDPNGLVYKDGIYHLYYQYNPFNISWNNMTWGHAVSRDLLHWERCDSVMFPDENGMMFSGCGFVNEKSKLGLSQDTLVFAYTAAGGIDRRSKGKSFVQRFAYSEDGGNTLIKLDNPFVDKIYYDSRDPKIFWHEESQAYVMVLWLRDHNFGILRSENLENWILVQEVTLEEGWECPDLFLLKDDQGNEKWFFWCAAGFYYAGDFDGYHFTQTQGREYAYLTSLPYAAQTYSNVEGKTIQVPWYRIPNDGRPFTSTYGIPVELSFRYVEDKAVLIQKPVSQLYEQMKLCETMPITMDIDAYGTEDEHWKVEPEKDQADVFEILLRENDAKLTFYAGEDEYCYNPESGMIRHDSLKLQCGYGYRRVFVVVDDKIVEIFLGDGERVGAFWNNSIISQIILYKKDIVNAFHYRVK